MVRININISKKNKNFIYLQLNGIYANDRDTSSDGVLCVGIYSKLDLFLGSIRHTRVSISVTFGRTIINDGF